MRRAFAGPEQLVRTAGRLDEVEQRVAVARGLGRDVLVRRVVVGPDGLLGERVELEGEAEDPLAAVHPVDLVAVGHVQVGRLHRAIAVAVGHRPGEGHERVVIVLRHVRGTAGQRVAVRVEDPLAVRVEGHVRPDLLPSAHDPAQDEVAERARLGRRERRRAAVGQGARIRGRSAAAAPAVVVVAVEVGADRRRAGVRLAVLAPGAVRVAGQVVHEAVGIDREDEPDLAAVDEGLDAGVAGVAVGQDVEQVERLLDGEMLAGVEPGVDEDLRLRLVERDVVADLGCPDGSPLVAAPDREDVDDARVGGFDGLDVGDHLRQVVVARVIGREVRFRGVRARDGRSGRRQRGDRGQGDPDGEARAQRGPATGCIAQGWGCRHLGATEGPIRRHRYHGSRSRDDGVGVYRACTVDARPDA